jgi:hypothetical protein
MRAISMTSLQHHHRSHFLHLRPAFPLTMKTSAASRDAAAFDDDIPMAHLSRQQHEELMQRSRDAKQEGGSTQEPATLAPAAIAVPASLPCRPLSFT